MRYVYLGLWLVGHSGYLEYSRSSFRWQSSSNSSYNSNANTIGYFLRIRINKSTNVNRIS